jgi:hypothetical protein
MKTNLTGIFVQFTTKIKKFLPDATRPPASQALPVLQAAVNQNQGDSVAVRPSKMGVSLHSFGIRSLSVEYLVSKLFRNVLGLNSLEMSSGSNQVHKASMHLLCYRVAEPRSEAERFRHPEWKR